MSDSVTDEDKQRREAHGLDVQPNPQTNDLPSAHDLVNQDIRLVYGPMSTYHLYMLVIEAFENLATKLGKNPYELMNARKAFGLEKYGTLLQPQNGRDQLGDALDELADALVYLRCALYEDGHE